MPSQRWCVHCEADPARYASGLCAPCFAYRRKYDALPAGNVLVQRQRLRDVQRDEKRLLRNLAPSPHRPELRQPRTEGGITVTEFVVRRGKVLALGLGKSDPHELLELLERPAWQADAACREHPEVTWFPKRGESSAPAKAVCERCLVRSECLAYGIEHEVSGGADGVWGGLSPRERLSLRRRAV